MPYIGNSLATQFQAFATQTITGDGSTGYTLDKAVANGKELLVYINNVKQEEGSGKSYTASGTTITFSAAVASDDSCYVVFLGSAVQTVVPPDGSLASYTGNASISGTLGVTGAITANGGAVFNEDSADVDFRVESNNEANMFVVDAGNDRIGIGTNAPAHKLDVVESADAFGARITNNSDGSQGLQIRTSDNDTSLFILDLQTSSSATGTDYASQVVVNKAGNFLVGKTASNNATAGTGIEQNGAISNVIKSSATGGASQNILLNRQDADGTYILFRQANSNEGTISVSGSTVSYNGFSGLHESSGIATNTLIGTVVSTVDELDVYALKQGEAGEETDNPKAGQTRADHAKVKVSDTAGDKAVYGVVGSFNAQEKVNVVSVGIGSVRVTGACAKGDLLESNGDGTAKVQSDDIVRSKTIGKVTIGNSGTGVKLVSCVLYCG